ncbi:hypothetical protein B0H17DRAFT_4069 [Mycena rosella]|uniref:F-box domain-containing protein n=1 Tax=Mycena rosella TaxID=1033263 RepID=A0AAD7H2W0_MYCRO|nr:hypothetical protein B0H17DRAFT_4069 [Mycena rosella]
MSMSNEQCPIPIQPPSSMDSQFPNELWLEICALLPPEALRNLSSTHCALYALARPLGFTESKLDPYPVHYIPPKARLDAALERPEFWSSPKIAPHVRSCTAQYNVSIWQMLERYYHSGPPVLVDAFLERLSRFTGLQRLQTDGIRWTQLGIVNLCALPALTHLKSSADHVADGERINSGSLTLHVSTFTTHYDNMNDIWISLLSRDSLRSLDLFSPCILAEPGVLPFPHVHTLSVNVNNYRTKFFFRQSGRGSFQECRGSCRLFRTPFGDYAKRNVAVAVSGPSLVEFIHLRSHRSSGMSPTYFRIY